MAIKQVLVCDCCGQALTKTSSRYKMHSIRMENQIIFSTDSFTDAAGAPDTNAIGLDLCAKCCRRGVEALETIAAHMNKKGDR